MKIQGKLIDIWLIFVSLNKNDGAKLTIFSNGNQNIIK